MKRKGPPFGRPDQVAVQSNQGDSTRPLLTQNDAPGIVDAWRTAVDALEPAWQTVTHLAHSLAAVIECGSRDEREAALAAIDDIAMRRKFSPRQLAELLAGLWGDGDVLGINETASSSVRTIVARSSGSDDRVLS